MARCWPALSPTMVKTARSRLKSCHWHDLPELMFRRLSPIIAQGQTSTFRYGPDGERWAKVTGLGSTFYIGNDGELSVTTATPGGQFTSYVSNTVRRVASATDFLVQDNLGSIRREARFNGAATPRDFAAYGMPVTVSGLTAANGRGYINERFDPETGLQYLHARYYDPDLGRFLSPDTWDPTIPGVDINRYAYAGNDPINGLDPSGHIFETPWDVANVVYDVGEIAVGVGVGVWTGDYSIAKNGVIDLGVDAASTLIPGVPAGSSKAIRITARYGDKTIDVAKNAARNAERATRQSFRSALERAGKMTAGQGAHHMVRPNSKAADILKRHGIDPQDIANGVGLNIHARRGVKGKGCGRHCKDYDTAVEQLLDGATSKQDVLNRLKRLEDSLNSNDKNGKSVDDWAREYLRNNAE